MKHRITPAEIPWFQAYARIGAMPEGTKLYADREYLLDKVWGFEDDDPHPPRVELIYREKGAKRSRRQVRRGDVFLLELRVKP